MKPMILGFGRWVVRHGLYAVIMMGLYGAIYLDAMGGDTPRPPADRQGNLLPETPEARVARLQEVSKFNESGVVESLELSILLVIMLVGGWVAIGHPEVRALAVLFSGWMGLAAIREQDQWFDQFAHGCWVVPAGLLGLAMLVHAWRKRCEICPGLVRFVHTPGWGLCVAGGVISMVFARLMGKKELWNYLIESPRVARNVKNMVEEGIETAGYALMLCALIESLAYLRRQRRDGRERAARLQPARNGGMQMAGGRNRGTE